MYMCVIVCVMIIIIITGTEHFTLTSKLQTLVSEGKLSCGMLAESDEHRQVIINSVIHCSDICNPMLPTPLAIKWALCITNEFYDQVWGFLLCLPYPRVKTPTFLFSEEYCLASQMTKGVLPVPPTLMLPTLITGHPAFLAGIRPIS